MSHSTRWIWAFVSTLYTIHSLLGENSTSLVTVFPSVSMFKNNNSFTNRFHNLLHGFISRTQTDLDCRDRERL